MCEGCHTGTWPCCKHAAGIRAACTRSTLPWKRSVRAGGAVAAPRLSWRRGSALLALQVEAGLRTCGARAREGAHSAAASIAQLGVDTALMTAAAAARRDGGRFEQRSEWKWKRKADVS